MFDCEQTAPGPCPMMAGHNQETTMNVILRLALASAGVFAASQAAANITLFEHDYYGGRSFETSTRVNNFENSGFNDRASSVVVTGSAWEVCEHARFEGRCVVLRPGRYASLESMGLNDSVSSARMLDGNARVDDERYAPVPVSSEGYRRRGDERLYEAQVTSVRAMVGTPAERCWVEREQVSQNNSRANAPGAIAGAIIGGVLGHQVGGGRGQDLATAGGAVAGAAIGANVGRDGGSSGTQDVRHCESVPGGARPAYWDVTYDFRGQGHRVQMVAAPGDTVTVNSQGEPRE
jgi:uncharacterized protein YcfJ